MAPGKIGAVGAAAAVALGCAGAAEALYGPLPFALSVRPSNTLPTADAHSARSFCVGLPAHSLGPSIAQKRAGSNYGKLDEEAAMRELERSLRTRACLPSLHARVLALPSDGGWERTPSCLRSGSQGGLRTYAWVSVDEPRWVGDDLNLVVHVSSAVDAGQQPPWWRLLDAPRRYATICMLEGCVCDLLSTRAHGS